MKEDRPILVIRLGGIGNVLFALPTVYALRELYPQSPIVFLTRSYHLPLVEMGGADWGWGLDKWSRPRQWISGLCRWGRVWSHLQRRSFRLVLDLQSFGETSILTRSLRAKTRAALVRHNWQKWGCHLVQPTRPRRPGEHQVDEFLRLARSLGWSGDPSYPRLTTPLSPSPQITQIQREWDRRGPRILLNPGASHPAKRRSPESWRKLAEYCLQRDWSVVILTGPAEKSLGREWRDLDRHPQVTWARLDNLYDLVSLISSIHVFVSVDTGPLHVAAATGVPVVAMFRDGYGQRYAPQTDRAVVLEAPRLDEIPREKLEEAVEEVVEKKFFTKS